MKLADRIKTLKRSGPLGLILLFFVSSVIIVLFVNFHERRQAREFAESKAMLLLDRNLATHHYFTQDLKPLLFDLLDEQMSSDYFDPLWMSSTYAIRKIDSYFQNFNSSGYYFKECAVNARSPFNEADEYERAFIEEINTNADVERRTAVREFDGELYLVFLRRGEVVEQTCLRCHSDAESAPKELIARYGKERGFGQKPGEYSSAISIRIPLSEAYAATTFHSVILSLFFVVLLLFVMAAQFLLIRERKRAEKALSDSEERFRRMYDSSMIGIAFCKETGEVTDANDAFLGMVGYTRQDVREGKVNWMEMTPPEYEHLKQRGVEEANAKGYCTPFEKEYIRKDGTRVPILIGGAKLKGEEGVGVAYAIDMTERKEAQDALQAAKEFTDAALNSQRDTFFVFDTSTGEAIHWNRAFSEISGYSDDEIRRMKAPDSYYGEEDLKKAAEATERIFTEGVATVEMSLIAKDGRKIPTEYTASMMRDKDGQAKYIISIGRDVTDRKRAEAEIGNLAKFPSENPNPVLRISNEGFILYANEASEAVLETWDIKEGEKLPAECYKRIEAGVESGGVSEFEFECSNGRIFSATLAPAADGGYVNVYGLDITERKEVEKALRESEELHRITIESISDAVFITDDNGDFTFICRNVNVIFGYSYAEAESLGNISKLLGDGLFDIEALKIAGEVVNIERDVRDKRGNNHSLLVNVKHVSIKNGTVLYTCRDISDRKEAAEALRVSEERFRRAVTEAPFPIMIHADDGEVLQINKVWTELTGYEPEEISTLSAWTQRAYGERKDVVKSRIDKIFNYDTRVEEGEYVISSRDGRMLTWDFSSAPLGRLTDGRRLVISMAMDVTDRKRSEEIIQYERDKLAAILDSMQDGVYIVNENYDIEYLNPVLIKEFGEAGGKKCYEYFHDRDESCLWCKNSDVFAGKTVRWQWYLEKNHKAYDLIDTPLRNTDGSISKLEILRDITELKKVQEKVESLARFPAENPNAVLRIRRDGAILYSNRAGMALENAWGCRRGQRLEGQWLEMVEKALNLGADQRGEIKYHGRVFSLVFAPVVESDYVNIYGLDITDLHEAEAALYWESSVNKALANLSNVLNKPYFSFEEISDFVLAHAKRLTSSKFGFAGYIDEQTGYLVCPTMTKEVWKQCRIQGKDIAFKEFNGLMSGVLNERKSVLANSPAEDPRAAGTPEGHVPIERFIGVPSLAGDEVIGMLAVANAGSDYVERDLWLVERLAETYALAIQSNRSQRRLEKHQDQLRDLVSSLGLAHERSARKLAAGLHAEVIDRLNSTRQSVASLIESEGKAPCVDSMPGVREALSDLVETTHAFASGLSCPVLRQLGLEAAVENWLTEDIRKKHGIETVFENDDTCSVFDEEMGHFLFEAIKELLTNTVEHARATRVKVSLKRDGDDVQVTIADDGIGFDVAGIGPKTGGGARYNLFCIGERLRHLGGDMKVDSVPGKGTTVVLKAPAKAMSG